MRRLVAACACLLACIGLAVRAQSPQESGAARLLVDAVALDRHGMPVADLQPGEVEVWVGHFRMPIDSMIAVTPGSEEHGGRTLLVLMDDVTLPLTMIGRAKEVARRLVTRMSPGDRMAIVMLDGSITETTDDRSRLLKAIDGYTVKATGVLRLDTLGEHVLKTVTTLAGRMVEGLQQRKTIVAIGTGGLLDRPLPPPQVGHDLLPEWIEAMRTLSLANTDVYVVDPSGVGSARAGGGDTGFARETGGFAYLNTNDLNGAADQIMREAGTYYLITVASPPAGGRGLRELEVKSLRKGVTLRARHAIH
jgi:VWFA-related protein